MSEEEKNGSESATPSAEEEKSAPEQPKPAKPFQANVRKTSPKDMFGHGGNSIGKHGKPFAMKKKQTRKPGL